MKEALTQGAAKEQEAIGSPVEVLIVEDSPTQAEQLQFLLEEHNYKVTVTHNGKEALAALAKRQPTLIITDIVMPEMDGFTLCRAIKSDPALKSIPVVMVTSLSSIQDIAKSLECGADNFIRKPYDPAMLLARINYIRINLELRQTRKVSVGMEVILGGVKHFISSGREQIIDLLISTYEEAVKMNEELQERQKDIARSNQNLEGLYGVANELNRVSTETGVCEAALASVMELPHNFVAGWILLCDEAGKLREGASFNLPRAAMDAILATGDCNCRQRLFATGMHVETDLVECAALKASEPHTAHSRFHASTPLIINDRRLGVMNFLRDTDEDPSEGVNRILETVANQVAVALERARLYQGLEELVKQRTAALEKEVVQRRHAEERLASLNRIYAVLSGINGTIVRIRNRDELCAEACRIAVDIGKFRLAWIGLVSPDTRKLESVACSGVDGAGECADIATRTIGGIGTTTIERVIRDKQPFVCNRIDGSSQATSKQGASAPQYRSMVALPLIVERRGVGALCLYSSESDFFDEDEMKLLLELAGDVSFALDYIEKEERLNYLAYYDALTGLPNRRLFLDRVHHQLLQMSAGGVVAMLVLNLERFTNINNTFGRHVGDALLKLVAERLAKTLGSTDRLARISADHFALAVGDCPNAAEVARTVEDKIFSALTHPFAIHGNELRISAKIGIAVAPNDGRDVETLFTNAESAFRKAKVSGDRYLFYTPEMNIQVADKLKLENRLRRALDRHEFVLHYQPIVSLHTGMITSFEALIRWNDPEEGLVAPTSFIPILEETGMIMEVGKWVLEQALQDYDAWSAKGLRPPRISVNISAVQLRQKSFLRLLEQSLAKKRMDRDFLTLELTESVLMDDIETHVPTLRHLRELGASIAVDDFGTGYSSLSYIAQLPIDSLKIDKSFIDNLATNANDVTIVSSIISLAHALNHKVIAEGVETEEQLEFLRRLTCDDIQGYVYARPMPADKVELVLMTGGNMR